MDLHLAGRKALVTGATRGIGKATALAYAREGADVAITWSNDASAAQEVASMVVQVGSQALTCRLDLEDQSSITRTLEIVSKRFDGLDVLVAHAVRWPTDAGGPLRDVSWNAWQRAVRTNIEGTAETLRNALPHLAASDAGPRRARLLRRCS